MRFSTKSAQHTEKTKISSPFVGNAGPSDLLATVFKLGQRMAANPWPVANEVLRFTHELGRVWAGQSEITPPKGDRRFAAPAWKESPVHHRLSQGYLAWTEAVNRVIEHTGDDHREVTRAQYVASLFTDAVSPANALPCNPVAMNKAVETGGASLVAGIGNALKDLASNDGLPSQVDKAAFRLGESVAATPGAVVFRNEVLELIQYAPTTGTVYARPVMLVPPIVNKFYLMDLAPGKSVVEFLVGQGFQTFMVSWRNPTAQCADWGLDTYVAALLEAMEAIASITSADDLNLYTVCTGIVPTASLMGHLAAKRPGAIHSVTTVVSVLDSNEGGSLGLFATPEALASAKEKSAKAGILHGGEMGKVFTWMRPNDLVWPCWINNYLLGNDPPAHDLLYWNNDAVSLPARLHAEVIDIYAHDALRRPGALTVLGTPIDLSQVTCDAYVVGGRTDHISLWKGVYNSARLLGGRCEFILHSGGHIQAVVCPPGTGKAHYHRGSDSAMAADPEAWLDSATTVLGSWWENWSGWLAQRSGVEQPAPVAPGNGNFRPLTSAPGLYVTER